jgi:hypothetical protein
MPARAVGAAVLSAVFATALVRAQPAPRLPALLDGAGVAELELEAPLKHLFEAGSGDQDATVTGTLSYGDSGGGDTVVFRDLAVSVRGHTSRRETECTFPKLKLKLRGGGSIRIGTHCGDAPDNQLSAKYGRLANEKSPLREALVYRMLQAAGVPTMRTRPARITYRDDVAGRAPLTRNALLIEDDGDVMTRTGGSEITMEQFGNVASRHAGADAGLIAFGEAMIGNFDWCLKYAADDTYRCDDSKPLWNLLAFARGNGTALVMKDFDLAGAVVGRHAWFDTVWNRGFVPSKSPIEIEVLSQVQRTRSLLPRDELDGLRRHFLGRRPEIEAAIRDAPVDEEGRGLARRYATDFFNAIDDDRAFYRPVVARSDVQIYVDPQRATEACGVKDVMRAGTPVNELRRAGAMSEVVVLDAMWRWAEKRACHNVQNGPVWIATDAITTDYPAAKRP